jgi:hypothetical protein
MHNSQQPQNTLLEMAISALDGTPNPLDQDLSVDPSPSSIDLPEEKCQTMCSRRSHPTADDCLICGQPLCDE